MSPSPVRSAFLPPWRAALAAWTAPVLLATLCTAPGLAWAFADVEPRALATGLAIGATGLWLLWGLLEALVARGTRTATGRQWAVRLALGLLPLAWGLPVALTWPVAREPLLRAVSLVLAMGLTGAVWGLVRAAIDEASMADAPADGTGRSRA